MTGLMVGAVGCRRVRLVRALGQKAKVEQRTDGATEMYLEVPMHSGESRPVRLIFGDGKASVPSPGAIVKTTRRSKLDMPERFQPPLRLDLKRRF